MIRRFAAQYIYFSEKLYFHHVVEMNRNDQNICIFPLEKEYAATEFYNGIIAVLSDKADPLLLEKQITSRRGEKIPDFFASLNMEETMSSGKNVQLLLFENIDFEQMQFSSDTLITKLL
ncbi:MAG: hypothetical protein FWF54_01280 [Candidatus Azobacteroides sp.]|nr:hypothetical protein [Candidatus Azobacteroides sp.]